MTQTCPHCGKPVGPPPFITMQDMEDNNLQLIWMIYEGWNVPEESADIVMGDFVGYTETLDGSKPQPSLPPLPAWLDPTHTEYYLEDDE